MLWMVSSMCAKYWPWRESSVKVAWVGLGSGSEVLVLAEDVLNECADKQVHAVLAETALCLAMFAKYVVPIVSISKKNMWVTT